MRLKQRRRVFAIRILSGPLLWTLAFMFIPYSIMFAYSFFTRKFPTFVPDFQIGNYITLFADPQYYQVLLRTLKIGVFTTIFSLILAYPLAYFLVFKIRSPRLRT